MLTYLFLWIRQGLLRGGCTPIVRTDQLVHMIETKYPEEFKKFEEGVKYVRRHPQVDDATTA